MAAESGHTGAVQLLLEARADPNLGWKTPLYAASGAGFSEIVGMLLRSRADANRPCHRHVHNLIATPLGRACQCGQVDVVRLLLEARADVEQACGADRPVAPLYVACEQYDENPAIVGLLLQAGAGTSRKLKRQARKLAKGSGHVKVARLLSSDDAAPKPGKICHGFEKTPAAQSEAGKSVSVAPDRGDMVGSSGTDDYEHQS